MSLLEKAKAYGKQQKQSKNIGPEDMELAFAWLRDEVTVAQIGAAYDSKAGSNMMYKMITALKAAYQQNLIKII